MDNQRLILLLVFFFSLVMLWEGWQKHSHPQTQTMPTMQANSDVPASNSNQAGAAALPAANEGTATEKSVSVVTTRQIRTDLFLAEISSQGGDLIRLELLKHHATEDKSRNFVLFDNGEQHFYQAQTGFIGDGLPNHKTTYQFVAGESSLKDGEDRLAVKLVSQEENGLQASKTYVFHRGSYLIDVEQDITNLRDQAVKTSAYFQTVRDGRAPEGSANGMMGVHVFTGPAIYTQEAKYQKVSFDDIANGKAHHASHADNGWIAMIQHYFVSAWLPQAQVEREFFTRKVGADRYSAGVILPLTEIAPGSTTKIDVPLYAGPQEQDKLEKIAPGFNLVVDYGWLTLVAAPLFWVLEMLHKLVGNWGWAIILLTVLLKAMFYPLSAAGYKSMAKMKVVAPKLTKLKETYGDDRARLNQEMMDLYKKEKINPLGGCLPILIQIPVFIALYWVLLGSVEMRYAPFIGYIHDLSAKDPYFILPIIMGATMFFQTRLNPAPPDPIQAKVMTYMPILFTGFFLFFPAGLVIYWIVNNVLSIAQQWQINRMIEGGNKAA